MSYIVGLANNINEYANYAALEAVPTSTLLDGQLAAITDIGLYQFLKDGTYTVDGSSVLAGLNGGQWANFFSVLGQTFIYVNNSNNSVINVTDSSIALTHNHILVGNSSNIAADVAMSGDATIADTGALTIANSAITNAKVSASAAIDFSKLATLTSGNILVGNGSNVAASVALSGDATLSNAGALTIANSAITTAKIADANVTLAKLAAGITPAYVVFAAGTASYAGGGTSSTVSVTGMQDTDIVLATLVTATNVVALRASHSSTTLTFTYASDPGTGTTIAYQVLRAAS